MRLTLLLLCTVLAGQAEQLGRGWWHGHYVTYKVRNGLAIYQGDVVLGRPEDIPSDAPATQKAGEQKDAAVLTGINNGNLWPGGLVPYSVDPAVKGALLSGLMQAIQGYNSNTPVRWTARTNEPNFVYFTTQPSGAASCGQSDSIGLLGGQQNIYVSPDPGCSALGTFTHEMGHALGLEHEQTRTDRDYYVHVRFENIDKNEAVQYTPDPGQIDVLPYNQGSIMHYGPFDFQRNTLNTIDTIPLGIPIEHRNTLSPGDLEAIRRVYGSPSSTTTIYTAPGGLSLIVDGQMMKTPVTLNWAPGSRHTLDIPPGPQQTSSGATTRYVFARWSNDGTVSQTITASAQTRIICANFSTQYLVVSNVGRAGGGSVSVNPASTDGYYALGTLITITARPSAGFSFLQWDNPGALSGFHGISSNPATFTVNFPGFVYTADFTTSPITKVTTNIPERRSRWTKRMSCFRPISHGHLDRNTR